MRIIKFCKTNRCFTTLLVTFICFLFTYFYYDFYYVEYEALFDSFYSGKLTEGMPFRSIYFLGNIGTSHLYSMLYELNPDIEWISWILYSYLFISCFIGLYIVAKLLSDDLSIYIITAVQIIVYFLVFADHNIHFIFTRVSYMVTGVSLIALLYFFRQPGSIKLHASLFVFLNFWFIVGSLTRFESATITFIIMCIFGIYYLQNVKRLTILFLFPLLFLSSVLFAIGYDLNTTTEYYKQVEPEIEAQFCERNNIIPISEMETARDSAIWKAAKNIVWIDPKVLTPDFMRSLIREEELAYTDIRHWVRVYNDMSAIAIHFWHMGAICALLMLAILIVKRPKSVFELLLFLLFVLSVWMLSAIQTYTVKINDRSFSPLMSIFIFSHLLVILPFVFQNHSLKFKTLLLAMLLLFIAHLSYLKIEADQLKEDLSKYRYNLKVITQIASGKCLAVNSSSCDYLFSSNKPFQPFDFSIFKKLYITDGFNMPYLPYYRRYLEKECNCDMSEFPSFWNYLRLHSEQVVVISDTERVNIIKGYLKEVYSYDLPLNENTSKQLLQLQKSDGRGFFDNLKVYSLER